MKKVAILLYTLFALLFSSCEAVDSCRTYKFSNNATYRSCLTLPVLNSFLYWNYDATTRKLDIAHRHTAISTSNWIAWAINPTNTGMVGSQALVAYQNSNGTMRAYMSSITSYSTSLAEENLSFPVSNLSATYANSEMIIFGTIDLPRSMNTAVNIVWQEGPLNEGSPSMHPTFGDNIRSMDSVDFLS